MQDRLIAPAGALTGTSSALESTFPVVRGRVVDQKPSGGIPAPRIPPMTAGTVYVLESPARGRV